MEFPIEPSNAGHRARLRRRFLDSGLGALHDHEALELLLTYAIPRRDVKGLAKQLIAAFGSFAAVFDAAEDELCRIPGVGENAAALIRLNKALGVRYLEQQTRELPAIRSFEDAADFIRMKIGGDGKETLMVLFLNAQKRLLGWHCVPGTVDRAVVFRREVIELCFRHKATAIILAHNHPSGLCRPSEEDIRLTRRIQEAAAANDIELVDHLIVTPTLCRSLKADRLI